MLAAMLQDTEVAAVEGDAVVIRVPGQNPVHAEGLERQRDALTALVAPFVAGAVKVRLEKGAGSGGAGGAGGAGAPAGATSRPARMTEDAAKGERLKSLRAKDPALNAAADALDLELLE